MDFVVLQQWGSNHRRIMQLIVIIFSLIWISYVQCDTENLVQRFYYIPLRVDHGMGRRHLSNEINNYRKAYINGLIRVKGKMLNPGKNPERLSATNPFTINNKKLLFDKYEIEPEQQISVEEPKTKWTSVNSDSASAETKFPKIVYTKVLVDKSLTDKNAVNLDTQALKEFAMSYCNDVKDEAEAKPFDEEENSEKDYEKQELNNKVNLIKPTERLYNNEEPKKIVNPIDYGSAYERLKMNGGKKSQNGAYSIVRKYEDDDYDEDTSADVKHILAQNIDLSKDQQGQIMDLIQQLSN